jgi:hypothetical protein
MLKYRRQSQRIGLLALAQPGCEFSGELRGRLLVDAL